MFEINNNIYQAIKDFIVKNRRVIVTLVHLIQVALANYLAFVLRFESILLPAYLKQLLLYLPILLVIRLGFYFQAGLYKSHLRYSGVSDLIKIIKSVTLGSITFFIIIRYLIGDTSYPLSIYILDLLLLLVISGGSRLSVRVAFEKYLHSRSSGKRMLIIGASGIGEKMVRDMKSQPQYGYNPIGFIDEDPGNKGLTIHGVPIFGPINMIPDVIKKHKPDEILVSMASSNNKALRKVFELSKPFNIPIKKLPELNDILNHDISESAKIGQRLIAADLVTQNQVQEALALQKAKEGKLGSRLVKLGYITEEKLVSFLIKYNGISSIKSISLEDLLQREPVSTNIESVKNFIEGKSVLVTGAGGSIGSELCRQIVKYNPSNMILLDRYENGLYEIDNELKRTDYWNSGQLGNNITVVIGDILDTLLLEYVFSKHKPHIVFHAAAHKHVPLMEDNPIQAVKNNIFGSKNVIDVATRHDAESFVMISTDKAVNPTSIMGATKRVAEFLTINMNSCSSTRFTTVRFGNVLGSNGSVVTLFKGLLKQGGPLPVTHPEMKRYFMLIPEAVQLVLTAAAAGKGGEIFVLDMGEQIKIVELAENLIRLSGFIPHKEIKIDYTGLRPGEKMYEELFDESEKAIPTSCAKLRIAVPSPPSIEDLNEVISKLKRIVRNNYAEQVIPTIQKIVHNFKSPYIPVPKIPSMTNKIIWAERKKRLCRLGK
jgi:FlaA1/EpsC-like NDP-sugar epimerase